MSVMSIRIDENKRKVLKIIAAVEGKTMSGIISELIEEYINRNKEKLIDNSDKKNLNAEF